MNAAHVTQLAERLQALHLQLGTFDVNLRYDFIALDANWMKLDAVWDGESAEVFKGEWETVRLLMIQYIKLATRYEAFLRERIEALRSFEQ